MPPGFLGDMQNKITFNLVLAWENCSNTEQNNYVYLTKKPSYSFWTYTRNTKKDVKWDNCIPPYLTRMFSSFIPFDNIAVLCSMFPFVLSVWLCTKARTLLLVNRERERRTYCKTGMKSSHGRPNVIVGFQLPFTVFCTWASKSGAESLIFGFFSVAGCMLRVLGHGPMWETIQSLRKLPLC